MSQYSVTQCCKRRRYEDTHKYTRTTPDPYINPTLSNMAVVAGCCFSPCTLSFHSHDRHSYKISLPSGLHNLPQHISGRFYSVAPALVEDLRLQDFPQHAFEQFASLCLMGLVTLVQMIRMVRAHRVHRYLPNCLMDDCHGSPS